MALSSCASAAALPDAAISTFPSGRFLTHPDSPSSRALSTTNHRNPTPCTRPLISRWMLSIRELASDPQERGKRSSYRCRIGERTRWGDSQLSLSDSPRDLVECAGDCVCRRRLCIRRNRRAHVPIRLRPVVGCFGVYAIPQRSSGPPIVLLPFAFDPSRFGGSSSRRRSRSVFHRSCGFVDQSSFSVGRERSDSGERIEEVLDRWRLVRLCGEIRRILTGLFGDLRSRMLRRVVEKCVDGRKLLPTLVLARARFYGCVRRPLLCFFAR
jgi:hypothetical protein